MLNLDELYGAMCATAAGEKSPHFVDLPKTMMNRITRSFVKDKLQFKRIAAALGGEDMTTVPLARFDANAESRVKDYLTTLGAKAMTNTLIKVRFVREVAVSLGFAELELIIPKKPKRNRITRTDEHGRRVKNRMNSREVVPPYRVSIENLPMAVQQDVQALERFCTATVVRNRKGRAHGHSTWVKNRERIERFAGALEKMGYPINEFSISDMADIVKVDAYTKFFMTIHGAPTFTLKDMLVWFQYVASNYLKAHEAAGDIGFAIAQTKFERVKNYDLLVQLVEADDLYTMAHRLTDHAIAYKAEWMHRKPCKAVLHPRAMCAYHFGRALTVCLALATWLRRDNLFSIVHGQHLYYRGGDLWFSFTADEMKSREPHMGQVRDLWQGDKALRRIKDLLAMYLELRPHLVERFLKAHPGEAAPEELILSKYGTPYSGSGQYSFFTGVSHAYLGADKVVNPHAIRHVIPSYLIKEHGFEIMGEIQVLLAHKSIVTTNGVYARAGRLFSAEKAEKRIIKAADQAEMADRLKRLEMKVDALRDIGDPRAIAEIVNAQKETSDMLKSFLFPPGA